MSAPFLANLPCRNKDSFSKFQQKRDVCTQKPFGTPIPVTVNVPVSEDEKKVVNDRVPLLLRYIQKHYGVKAERATTSTAAPSSSSKRPKGADDQSAASSSKSRRVS